MKLSQAHFDAFKEKARGRFEDRMIEHLRRCFPSQFDDPGEEALRELIRAGVDKANGYGFVAERDVCKFIDLMVVFGEKFDKDRSLPWAREILSDPEEEDPSERIERLFDAALEHARPEDAGNGDSEY